MIQRPSRICAPTSTAAHVWSAVMAGAPAQIYASANVKWMNYVADKGLIEKGTRKPKADEMLGFARLYGRSLHELVRPLAHHVCVDHVRMHL